jgi:hypothetical protein
MFSTSYKVVLDPSDFRPVLVMVTTHRRRLRATLRRIVGPFTNERTEKRRWHGLEMWMMFLKFDGDRTTIDQILIHYPPMKIQLDQEWGYWRV